MSVEYKYDILSEKMLNCAVEHVRAVYVRNPSKQKCMRRTEQWLTVPRVLTLGDEARAIER
ncbi:MAG: hypothetical protein ACYTBJ_23195 [Planctomycetota bacterium]